MAFKVTSSSADKSKLRSLLETVAMFAPFSITVQDLEPVVVPPVEPPAEPPVVVPPVTPPAAGTRYISATGTGNGTTPAVAAPTSAINDMILSGASTVELLGEFPGTAIRVNAAPASTVTIRGGSFKGSRFDWELPASEAGTSVSGKSTGSTVFIIHAGAKNLRFEDTKFEDVGIMFDMANVTASDLAFVNITSLNARDNFYTNEGSNVSNVLIDGFKATGFSKKAIRIHGKCHHWTIKNPQLNSGWQSHDNFAVGIEMYDTAHDILIDGGWAGNARDTQSNNSAKYWNGDGISSERGVSNVTIRNFRAFGSTDGGVDLKSTATLIENCVFEDNKRNIRIWGEATIRNCQSINPRKRGGTGGECHVWGGNGAKVTIENLTADGPGLLAENDGAEFIKIVGLTLKNGATRETRGAVQIS